MPSLQLLNRAMKKAFGEKYGKLVFGHGDEKAKIMLIGEAPGREEEKQGRPFVGRAGKVLNQALEAAGIGRKKIYITNVVKTRPPLNRKPKSREVREFLPFLFEEIEIIKPKITCLLGGTATEALLGNYPITKNHGRVVKKGTKQFLITYHPAAILRNPNLKKVFESDIKKLRKFF